MRPLPLLCFFITAAALSMIRWSCAFVWNSSWAAHPCAHSTFKPPRLQEICAIVWPAMVMLVYCSSILIKLFHVFQAPIGQAFIANLAKTMSLHMSEPGGPGSPRFEIDYTSTLHCAKVTTATSLPYMERYLAKSNPLKSADFMYVSTGRGAFDSASFWFNLFAAACKDPKPPNPLTTMVLARPDMFGTGPCCMRLVCFKESVWD